MGEAYFPGEGPNSVQQNVESNTTTSTNSKREKMLQYLQNGEMQGYIDALLQNGVSRPVSKTRDIHSVNYFRKESRDILKYASQKLCKDPNSTSMQQCIHYVDDLLGDTEEGRELGAIICSIIFPHATEMHNNGVNISEPTEEKKILDELVDQKQQLIKNITTSLRQIDQVMESNLIEKFETQRGNASIGGLEYLQAILGLFAGNIDDAIKNFDKIRDTVSFDIHMN